MEFQTTEPQKNGLPNATAVLALGIISIIGCFCYGIVGLICGIIAIVLANKDLRLYNSDPYAYTPSSYSNIKTGRTCAIIGLSMSALYFIVVVICVVIFGLAGLTNPDIWLNR